MPNSEQLSLPQGTRGKVLALALLAGAMGLFVIGVLLPALEYWDQIDADFRALQTEAEGHRRLAAREGDIARRLSVRQTEFEAGLDFLTGADPAVAAAQTLRDLGAVAETAGVSVRATLMLPATESDGFLSVAFQVSITGDLRAVRDFLYEVEANQPRLIVDRLLLEPAQPVTPGAEEPDALYNMTLDIHGYMQQEPKS